MNLPLTKNINLDACYQIPYMKVIIDKYTTTDDWNKQISWIQEHLLSQDILQYLLTKRSIFPEVG